MPSLGDTTLAVVPCLNEERTIADVIKGIRQYLSHILVVDDGSTDRTAPLAQNAGATVLHHPRPQGKGASLRDGVAYAAEKGFSHALFMDGDGQHDPADIPQFVAAAHQADLVAGNRFANPQGMPRIRQWANRFSSRLLSKHLQRDIPDAQCGFRLVRVAAWQSIPWETAGYEIEAEMLVRFFLAGFSVVFVPIRTIYGDERSKFHPVHDALRWWCWWRQTSVRMGKVRQQR